MDYSFEKHRIGGGIAADDEYWRALERGEFRIPQCTGCRTWIWPAHYRCATCGSWDMDWIEVEPRGRVFSWIKTHYSYEWVRERDEDLPYTTILAELPQCGGARVMGVMIGSEAGLEMNAAVVGEIDPPSPKTKGYPAIRWRIVADAEDAA